jgi:hypothetical protein
MMRVLPTCGCCARRALEYTERLFIGSERFNALTAAIDQVTDTIAAVGDGENARLFVH